MSSIKERIAALNAKPQESVNNTTPPIININADVTDDSAGESGGAGAGGRANRRQSLSIADRIALMKANSAQSSTSSLSAPVSSPPAVAPKKIQPEKPKEHTGVDAKHLKQDISEAPTKSEASTDATGEPSSTTSTKTATPKRKSLSVAERIALMKANSAGTVTSSVVAMPTSGSTQAVSSAVTPLSADSEGVSTSETTKTETSTLTREDKISKEITKEKAEIATNEGGSSVNTSSSAATSTSSAVQDTTAPRRLSVTEKIVAMKAASLTSASTSAASSTVAPPAKDSEGLPLSETKKTELSSVTGTDTPASVSTSTSSTTEDTAPKKLSVAEKIAAMKAKSAAQSNPITVPPKRDSGGSSTSMAEKIALLKKKSFDEANSTGGAGAGAAVSGSTRDSSASLISPTRPKSATIATSTIDEDDVFDRPASLNVGMRKKLNPNLMARASIAMPMMMPGMVHPGLNKRASMGDIMGTGGGGGGTGLSRSSSIGSIRVTNEGEIGEITHSTMTRATTVKKKRKSSVNHLSLLKSNNVMEALPSVRVSTVQEGEDDEEEGELEGEGGDVQKESDGVEES